MKQVKIRDMKVGGYYSAYSVDDDYITASIFKLLEVRSGRIYPSWCIHMFIGRGYGCGRKIETVEKYCDYDSYLSILDTDAVYLLNDEEIMYHVAMRTI